MIKRKNTQKLILLFLIFGILEIQHCFSNEIKVGFSLNKPPYVFKNQDKGIEIEIFKAVFKLIGYRVQVINMPQKRLDNALELMKDIDAVTHIQKKKDGKYFWIEDYLEFNNYAITKKKHKINIDKISDLTNQPFVSWKNAHEDLGKDFLFFFGPKSKGVFRKNYTQYEDQVTQNKLFWSDRIRVIIVDKIIFHWNKKNIEKLLNINDEIIFHNIFRKNMESVAFRDEKLAHAFIEGLKKIKNNGKIKQIYQKYIE